MKEGTERVLETEIVGDYKEKVNSEHKKTPACIFIFMIGVI